MSEPASQPSGPERRRSARVIIEVGVFVEGTNVDGRAFGEKTRTASVNAHGALIHLSHDIQPGDIVTLTHSMTREQQTCRVVYVNPDLGMGRPVGVEFLRPAPKFWRIAFPPKDWIPFEDEVTAAPLGLT